MDRYALFVGKRVEVEYRAGDVHLNAAGTLAAVKDKCITLEDHFAQDGKKKTMRLEIPHVNVIRIDEAPAPAAAVPSHAGLSLAKKRG